MSKDFPTFDEKFSIALCELRIRALLLGGVACNIYGSTRYSEDIDWWIGPTEGIDVWIELILKACLHTKEKYEVVRLRNRTVIGNYGSCQNGPEMKTALKKIIEEDAVVRLQNKESKVDAFFLPYQLEDFEKAWSRSKPWDQTLRVLSIEDLILTKTGTERCRDLDDIRFLKQVKQNSS